MPINYPKFLVLFDVNALAITLARIYDLPMTPELVVARAWWLGCVLDLSVTT